MQFQSITINNLFSYYGSKTLVLDNGKDCNITVLVGRNGYGKTSFINSVKMLFIDTAEEIRRTIQRKRTPTAKQFVEGITNEWWGILNQKAKQNGEMVCSVAAQWTDDDGHQVSAKREWNLSLSHESSLTIKHDFHGLLYREEAEAFLENIIPRSFLPFFFFDGEEIQAVAEANDNEIVRKMELLLNIRPLEDMQEALNILANEWRKKGQNESAKKELNDKENELQSKEQQQKAYQQELSDLQIEIEHAEDKLKKLDRKLRWLRGGVSQEAESKLKAKIEITEKQREQLLEELALFWKKDAVLAVHPDLIQNALTKIEGIIHSSQGDQEELLQSIKQRLGELFSTAPYPTPKLTHNQAVFYKKRIMKELDAVNVVETIDNCFDVSYELGKKLYSQLNQYTGNNLLNSLSQQTSSAQSLWKDIHDATNKLKATGKLSQEKQIEYETLLQQESNIKNQLIDLKTKKNIKEKDLEILQRKIKVVSKELDDKRRALRVATEYRQQHDFSQRLSRALSEVKSRLKRIKREELEEKYNQHLSDLLDSHGLIYKVKINENFEISYRDDQENEIGMSTISAGMKQLSATALLWALKDISGREIPIIIDTPMGRIDAKHQENLLKKYYPKVGKQVILLPTDSELDERKYKLLQPHICKLYKLENSTGNATRIIESTEY